ncbi:MAG TPA: hypothetical protein VMD30_07510, partial [Tepidisphaeraceae bacterium]|nr:hypothetical protein [Tepidisphaeraceae bacterium]
MRKVIGILSMLHEPPGADSATRLFRGKPVLAWTLSRLSRSRRLNAMAILCWDDQTPAATAVAEEHGLGIFARGPRAALPEIESVCAARRWADGWRGGLLSTCEFDRGFHGPWMREICGASQADAIVAIDPAAGLVDAALIDGLIEHAQGHPQIELCFSQAAPGLSGVWISAAMLDQLVHARSHPGKMLCYRPEMPRRDPIGTEACAPIPTPLARTTRRFTLDSQRQIHRASVATEDLNGELLTSQSQRLLACFEASKVSDPLPRHVIIELNTRRATDAIYWPGRRLGINRPDLPLEKLRPLFRELAMLDDTRITFAGVGDPLLRDDLWAILATARNAGINALAVETDLFDVPPARVVELAESAADVVCVNLPAVSAATYRAVCGVDGIDAVLSNIRTFVQTRQK